MDRTSQPAGRVDHRTVDWPRVRRVVYQVRQHYRYTYTDAIWELKQHLMMIPPDCHHDQRLLEHRLELRGVAGSTALHWERDRFGNRVGCVRAEQVPRAVDFEAHYRVERRGAGPEPPCGPAALSGWDTAAYLELTALTAPDRRLETVARDLGAGPADRRTLAERAHDWAAGAISYQAGLTGVQTPAAMALHLGRGVCQDYAHLMLAVLRLLGVPARYVSGHLLGEGAPHAWVEALVESASGPGQEVVAYDPTHHRRVGLSYITVAVGRDYADITPTSGFFSGPATGRLHWSKQAEVVEVEHGPGDAQAESRA